MAFIYVDDFKYHTCLDLKSSREELIKKIFTDKYEAEITSPFADYELFKKKVVLKIEELLKKHPIPESLLPIFRDRFEEKDVYIYRNFLGKRLKLFQGGNDALISFLISLLNIIDYAINKNRKIIIMRCNTHMEFLVVKKAYT